MININEIFAGIEGEGLLKGEPSIFIRTQGCSIQCPFCDTKHSWKETEENMSEEDILKKVQSLFDSFPSCKNISITGGNPTEQDLRNLVEMLRPFCNENLIWIKLEHPGIFYYDYLNSGSSISDEELDLLNKFDFISFDIKSPSFVGNKIEDLKVPEVIENLDEKYPIHIWEIKYVFRTKEDVNYFKSVLRSHSMLGDDPTLGVSIVVNPCTNIDGTLVVDDFTVNYMADFIMKERVGNIRLGVQLHKVLNLK